MIDHSELWKQWEQGLSRWQLRNLAVTLLESSGAFHPVIAQFLLMSQPMFGQTARKHMDAIVELLEEPEMCRAFTDYLAQEFVK
jgi:hypothetical protein